MILPSPACICQAPSSWGLISALFGSAAVQEVGSSSGRSYRNYEKKRFGRGQVSTFEETAGPCAANKGSLNTSLKAATSSSAGQIVEYTRRLVSRVGGGGAATTPTHHHRHPAGRWLGNHRHRIGRDDGKGRSYLISFPPQSLLILFAVLVVLSNNQGGNCLVAHVPCWRAACRDARKREHPRAKSLDPGRPGRELGRAVVLSSRHDVELAQWIGPGII